MSIDLARLNAALEGRYTIERELGEGGMAVVFLADDLKHDRKVALKVLKPELASVVGGDRFISEIKTTANLQHPHILPLFDSGEVDSFLFYVMPYVEGETLRDRLDRERQLPVEEAVGIARKVAAALQVAHEQGIIHRDIKPANILMQRGEPVVSDFGIALAVSQAGGGRLTETGLSLGTPYYMAPEQATGDQDPDARSDLYSLACVLYEMLVGEPPFTGGTAQAVLGRILTSEPTPPSEIRRSVPPDVEAAILHALDKTPADRFPSTQAWADELARADLTWSGGHTRPVTRPTARDGGASDAASGAGGLVWKVGTAVFGLAAATFAALYLAGGASDTGDDVLRYEMLLPVEIGANTDWGSNVAISPDGRTVVYSGLHEGGELPGLWVRSADRLESVFLTGTALGVHPEFSPDGTRVAFISDDRELRVASLEGRPAVTLYQDPWLRRGGLSWSDDGFIYFTQWDAQEGNTVVFRIAEDGEGEIEQITSVGADSDVVAHYFPDVIPDSEWLLTTIARRENYNASTRSIGITRIGSNQVVPIADGMQAIWSETGHVLVVRGDGVLVAGEFDRASGQVGPLIPVFEGVQVESLASADVAISDNGTLVYVPGRSVFGSDPVWVDRTGLVTPVDPAWTGELILGVRISPDGSRVAFSDGQGLEAQVSIKELGGGPTALLTSEGVNARPAWFPGGEAVAFVSNRRGGNEIFQRVADGSLPAELLVAGSAEESGVDRTLDEIALSPDGQWQVVQVADDLYYRSTTPGSELIPLLAEPAVIEGVAALSPDGRWIAYVSTEGGQPNVYVRPFPDVDRTRALVSDAPATGPRWAPDMSEVYYRTLSGDFVAASVNATGSSFSIRSRTTLFPYRGFVAGTAAANYDVHPDGDRFLMVRLGEGAGMSPVEVFRGFAAELRSAMSEAR